MTRKGFYAAVIIRQVITRPNSGKWRRDRRVAHSRRLAAATAISAFGVKADLSSVVLNAGLWPLSGHGLEICILYPSAVTYLEINSG